MDWLDFVVLVLSASDLVDVWFNGSLFADYRATMQDKADNPDPPVAQVADDDDGGEPLPPLLRLLDRIVPPWMAELFSCRYCFSHHTPWLLALLFFVPAEFLDAAVKGWWVAGVVFLLKLPVYSLAATRLGNILNSILPEAAKYER